MGRARSARSGRPRPRTDGKDGRPAQFRNADGTQNARSAGNAQAKALSNRRSCGRGRRVRDWVSSLFRPLSKRGKKARARLPRRRTSPAARCDRRYKLSLRLRRSESVQPVPSAERRARRAKSGAVLRPRAGYCRRARNGARGENLSGAQRRPLVLSPSGAV